jgi:hypothetical protein
MADDTPQDPAPQEPEQDAPQPETGEAAKDEDSGKGSTKAVLADLARERKERQRLAKELESLRQQSMSDAEKAVAEAEKRGEKAAVERYAIRLVDEAFRAATVGRVLTPDALLSFDRKAFLAEDGDIDRDSLSKWVAENSVDSATAPRRPAGDVDQGVRKTEPQRAQTLGDAVAARLASQTR